MKKILNKLNLGQRYSPKVNFVDVNTDPALQADIIHDIEMLPWPFDDNQIEFINKKSKDK